jgi:hypothetical protein
MELKTLNMLSIEIRIDYNSEVDEEMKKAISNKIIVGLKKELPPYNNEESINEISVLRLRFRLKKGARCVMTEPKSLINKMIEKSIGNYNELINYEIDVEAE